MHLHIHNLIQHDGYFGVFMILLVEMIGIPFPAETTLTLSGVAWSNGSFALIPLLVFAILGNVIGSTIAYGIGFHLGRPFILRFGKYVGIRESHLQMADEKFAKYRTSVVLFAKFIAGIRVLVPYLAGMNRMPLLRFSLLNLLGASLWATFFIVIGRYVGVAWIRYHKIIHPFIIPGVIILVLVAATFLAVKLKRRKMVTS